MPDTFYLIIVGMLEDVDNDFLYIMKSAQPELSSQQLLQLLQQFHGGPRRPWEVVEAGEKRKRYLHYFQSLSAEIIGRLQDIYKWDILIHGYKLYPLTGG